MTDKEQRFAEEYLVDLNATQAAIRAGYSETSAHSIGFDNLRKPEIDSMIQKLKAERSKRTEITADRTLQEIAKRAYNGFSAFIRVDKDGQPQIDLSACGADQLDCLTETSTETVWEKDGDDLTRVRKAKIKAADNGKYLEMLMRHLGQFNDKSEVKHEFNLTTEERADRLAAILDAGRARRDRPADSGVEGS